MTVKTYTVLTLLLLSACSSFPVGELNGACKSDGTCNGDHLSCERTTAMHGPDYICSAFTPVPPRVPGHCYSKDECFCARCAELCISTGLKECHWNDTTVWGAKPTVCECK